MKLCSTCARGPTRRRQPGKSHQQTTQPWHGTKLNSRWPAVSRVGSYILRESILLERRVICIGGIKIEHLHEIIRARGLSIFLEALAFWMRPVYYSPNGKIRQYRAVGLHSDSTFYIALEKDRDKSDRTHLVRTLSGDGGLLDSRLSMACHSLRHDRSLSIRCS